MEQVPALVVNESKLELSLSFNFLDISRDFSSALTLTQSVAIMEYIHDMRPSSGLLPASVEDRARVRMVTEMVASGIQP